MSTRKQQQPAGQEPSTQPQDDPYAPSLGRIFSSFGLAIGITALLYLAAKYLLGII